MGHREKLLAGARQCLFEKGFARTTARDIVAASGTNLASIGYYYGSKDALLFAAMEEALDEWDLAVDEIIKDSRAASGRSSESTLADGWSRMIATYAEHHELLVVQVEAWAQATRSPELREHFAELYERIRQTTAKALLAYYPELDEETARAVCSVFSAIAEGLMVQWMVDPERAPTGRDVQLALEAAMRMSSPPADPPAS